MLLKQRATGAGPALRGSVSVALIGVIVSALLAPAAAAAAGFVTRTGTQLFLDGQAFRWGGLNIYWLGLDENVGGIQYPTQFRIRDALDTAAAMGATVIRAHTLGISTGNPKSFEPSLGVFNATALDAADYAIWYAGTLGLKLVVPLTDNYHYYHGGKHNFCDWLGLPESVWFTDSRVLGAFQDYIAARLKHVNPYTGRAAAEEPAIAVWETGNEFSGAPAAWTESVAAFIKSIDANHLVMDGNYGIVPQSLPSPSVDMYSDHFYPVNTQRLFAGLTLVATADKAYLVGEYGWTSGDVAGFLAEAQAHPDITGTQFWSLFPHLDTYGFEQHGDGFSVHFPGDNAAMSQFVATFHAHAANMSGKAVQPYPAPATPAVTFTNTTTASGGGCVLDAVAWRGAAAGSTYTLESAVTQAGPWVSVCANCGTDNNTPISVAAAGIHAPVYVRVRAVGPQGAVSPWSPAVLASC